MTVRITESRIPSGYLASELGQTNEYTAPDGAKYVLVSFLSSPLRVKTIHEYAVFVINGAADEYRWTIEPPGGPSIRTDTTQIGSLIHFYTTTGTHEVRVEVVDGGTVVATLLLLQTVMPPDPALEQHFIDQKVGLETADTLRELRTDLGTYIQWASNLTGPEGIPTRFISIIVFLETLPAPKRGSMGWYLLKKAGKENKTREAQHEVLAALYERGKPVLGTSPLAGSPPLPGTLGPGQVAQWRAAALETWMTWRELPTGVSWKNWRRKRVVLQDVTEFTVQMSYDLQVDCFNLCRFPKTNVVMVAKLLARLKNRAHRWPDVLKENALTEPDLLGIIATEYHIGPTETPRADAVPDAFYGPFAAAQNDSWMSDLPPALFP